MCSIIGSFNKKIFLELMELNEFRGSFSFSLTSIDPKTYKSNTVKAFGKFDDALLDGVPEGWYMLGHLQNPTGGLIEDVKRIHPAVIEIDAGVDRWDTKIHPKISTIKLLHNGIIKPATMELIASRVGRTFEWDTEALLEFIISYYEYNLDGLSEALSRIDGSFSCAMLREGYDLLLFRNSVAPMYYDEHLTISSIPFKHSNATQYNIIYNLDLLTKTLVKQTIFANTHYPFYYDDE